MAMSLPAAPTQIRVGLAAASAVLVGALGVMATTGCDITTGTGADSGVGSVPTNSAGVEQWDLRKPPTRADVGMHDGEDFVAYEDSDDPRPIEVLLPEGRALELDNVYLVTFDRITSPSLAATSDSPLQMDFRPKRLRLDDAEELLASSLRAIGADPALAGQWRARVQARPQDGPAADRRIEGGGSAQIGYLTIGVGAVFNPLNDDGMATLKYHVNFVE